MKDKAYIESMIKQNDEKQHIMRIRPKVQKVGLKRSVKMSI